MKSINSRRKAIIGEVHEWQGGKFRKTPIGWERVEDPTSKRNSVIEELIHQLEPSVLTLLDRWEVQFEEQFEKEMTEYDKEMARLQMLSDIVNAFEKYTKPSDVMSDLRIYNSPKGSFEISADIIRDGITYPFRTEVIYAGGYNIQKLHFRYLISTKLPQTGNKILFTEISEKIKRLTKLEKLNKDLEYMESVKKRDITAYERIDAMSDEEILEQNEYWRDNASKVTWETIVERGADKNFDFQEEKFNESQREYSQKYIAGVSFLTKFSIILLSRSFGLNSKLGLPVEI